MSEDMNTARSIARNTLFHVSGRIGAVIIGVATLAVLARHLGTNGFGQYATILAVSQFSSVFADLGLYLITLKLLSETNNESKTFSSLLSLRIASGFVLFLVTLLGVWFLPYPLVVQWGIVIFSLSTWLLLINQIIIAGLQKHLSVGRAAIAEIAGKGVVLGVVLTASASGWGLLPIVVGYVAGSLTYTGISLFALARYIPIKLSISLPQWKAILSHSLPLAVSSIFTMVYFKMDTVFLSLFWGEREVGIYAAPYRALEVLISFAPMLMGLVMPLLTQAWVQKDTARFRALFQKTANTLTFVVLLFVAVAIPLAEDIIGIIAGNDFIESAPVLRVLIIATSIIYLAHATTYAVIAIGKQKTMIGFYGAAALLALGGYLLFIPRYSYWAAAYVTLAVELFILLATWMVVWKQSRVQLVNRASMKAIIASGVTAAVLWEYGRPFPVLVSAGLGTLLYTTLLIMFRAVNWNEMRELFFFRKQTLPPSKQHSENI